MTPTNKLRFVERIEPIIETTGRKTRVLQQWWEEKQWAHDDWIVVGGEWRDVPMETEDAPAT